MMHLGSKNSHKPKQHARKTCTCSNLSPPPQPPYDFITAIKKEATKGLFYRARLRNQVQELEIQLNIQTESISAPVIADRLSTVEVITRVRTKATEINLF